MRKTVAIIIFIIIAAVAGKFLASKKAEVANAPTAVKPTISLKLSSAENSTLLDKKSYLATLSADKSINVSSKLSGYIQNIHVKEGDVVKKGTPLVQIDSTEIRSEIESLKSSQAAMQKDLDYKSLVYERNLKLYEKQALSKENLELSAVALSLANSNINTISQKIISLLNQLEYLNIKASSDGVVSTIFLHKGDLAAPNKPILKLNSKTQKLNFSFTDKNIKKGLPLFINSEKYGEIKTIYDDSQNGLKVAEVELFKEIDSVNGESFKVDVIFSEVSGCVVDNRAILYNNGKSSLVVYADGAFKFLDVEIVLAQKDKTIVTPCTNSKIAVASQSKLAILPQYKDVNIIEAK